MQTAYILISYITFSDKPEEHYTYKIHNTEIGYKYTGVWNVNVADIISSENDTEKKHRKNHISVFVQNFRLLTLAQLIYRYHVNVYIDTIYSTPLNCQTSCDFFLISKEGECSIDHTACISLIKLTPWYISLSARYLNTVMLEFNFSSTSVSETPFAHFLNKLSQYFTNCKKLVIIEKKVKLWDMSIICRWVKYSIFATPM